MKDSTQYELQAFIDGEWVASGEKPAPGVGAAGRLLAEARECFTLWTLRIWPVTR